MTTIPTQDWITRRRMRRAAQNCLIAIRTGHVESAIMSRATYLSLATDLRARGVVVGSMIGEAHT